MTVLPKLENALTKAARDRWGVAPTKVHQRRRRIALVPKRASGLMLTALLVTGTALAAIQPWSPLLGNDDAGHPTTTGTPVPSDQVAALSVLRRQPTDRDRGPDVQRTLRLVGPQLHGVRTDSVRFLAALRGDAAVTLVSTTRFGDDQDPAPDAAGSITQDPLCVLYPIAAGLPSRATTSNGVAYGCWTMSDIRVGRGRAMAPGNEGTVHAYGLVPDGVHDVTASFPDGTTVTTDVNDNFFDLTVGNPFAGDALPNGYRWRDAAGNDVTPPTSR
jgi:hypothetical protein